MGGRHLPPAPRGFSPGGDEAAPLAQRAQATSGGDWRDAIQWRRVDLTKGLRNRLRREQKIPFPENEEGDE